MSGNLWLNGLQAIDGWGWLRRGSNPGVKAGGVKVWRWQLEQPSRVADMAEGGGIRRWHNRTQQRGRRR
jgi:hypothetical protein